MKPRLLFIKHKSFNARTVDNDVAILNQKYEVKLYDSKIGTGTMFLFGFIIDFVYLIFSIYRFKVVFIWFGDYHSLLPSLFAKLTGKTCVLCLGGYDAHWIVPDKAVTLKEKVRKFCVMKSIKYANYLFPVSNWLAGFVKQLKKEENIQVAYCCVDPKYLDAGNEEQKENLILTVGGGGILYETKRKKLDFFIEVGNFFNRKFPEYNAQFLVIGHNPGTETYEFLAKYIKSPNVEILPLINGASQLSKYFGKAKVYCQFSEYEAFGIAVIEAMLNGVIPIVFEGGAMPEIIGFAGLTINKFDIEQTALLIKGILDNNHENLRSIARERVLNNFTIDKRKEIIYKYL